jgi:hypothetical protein
MKGNIVDIPLKGIARAGSNQSCEDGLCNEVIGLEWKDGSYTPIQSVSGQINWLSTDVEEAWIHKTSYGDNLIVREKNNVFKYYINSEGNPIELITISDNTHNYKIDILGNMLRINDNIFLYNGEEYKNQNIGDIDFSMQLGVRRNGIAVLHRYYDSKIQQDFNDIGESWFQTASKYMLKQLESEVKEKGYFTGMAYMRYALKLYDGTYIHLSNPVLVSDNFFNFDGTNDKHENTLDLKKGEAKEYISVMKYMGYLVNMGWAFTTKYQDFSNDDYRDEYIKPQDLIYSNRTFLMENFPFRSYGGINTMKWSDDGKGALTQTRNEKEYDKDPFSHHLTEDFEGKSTDAIKKIGDLFLPSPLKNNPNSQIWKAAHTTSGSENWFAWKTDGDIGNITEDFVYDVNINPEFCYYANGLGLVYDSGNKIDADKKDYQFFGMRGLATPILSINKNLDGKWRNMVTSVDVFMTRPVDLFKNEMGVNRRIYKDGSIIKEELHNSLHSFYKILEIPFDDLLKFNSNEIYVPYIESARIAQIEQQETLEQNYPHTDYYKKSYMYNGRLHISDLKTKYKKGFSVDSVSIFNREENTSRTLCVRVTIEENGKVDYVDSTVKIEKEYFSFDINGAIVYPNENAKSIEFLGISKSGGEYYPFKDKHIYPLKSYNGFAINTTLGYINFSKWETSKLSSYPKINEKEITDRDKNIFKVSSANNLINFPLINTYQVGNGDIVGFASSTRALSQGQFGQYPLYVFTTEGIYAMEQTTTGTYSSSQPISREVCCNPNGILQLDGSVLFTTTKGLMLLSGTEVVPFAPLLVGEVGLQPQTSDIVGAGEVVYSNAINNSQLVTMQDSISMSDFRDYVSDLDTRLSYIYDKNKVLVYNKNHNYSYLIDLQTQITTKIGEQILFDDGNYPTSSYAMSNGSNIELKTIPYKLDNGYTQTMFQTRPIKLGTYDLKSSFRVVLRGKFDVEKDKFDANNDKKAGLYVLGSNDTERWMYLGGTERSGSFYDLGTTIHRVSCKYLMVIYVGSISGDSKINGLEISSNVKYNNKLK